MAGTGTGTEDKSWIRNSIETLFRVYNKSGKLVDFKLNPTQAIIDETLNSGVQILDILKARQKGCSTYIMARFLVECMEDHQVVAMLAHDKEHTEKLLRRSQELLSNMKGAKPRVERANANEIYFKKTQSSFYIGTAGSKDFGRSATITRLHCSELAFWKEPKELFTGLLQAIPFDTGVIVKETTANGWGNYHQKQFYRALANPSNRNYPLFIPWNIDPEYQSFTPFIHPLTEREEELVKLFSLSIPQLQWRREKMEQLEDDEARFMQEYPLSYEQAFMVSGSSLFNSLTLAEPELAEWRRGTYESRLEGHPRKGFHYVLGADSSGGTGNDDSAIVVGCLETKEQVYEFHYNKISPPAFGEKVAEVGKLYNKAYLVPESNSHGLAVLAILKKEYPLSRIYRNSLPVKTPQPALQVPSYSYGWRTGAISKPYMVGMAVKFIEEGFKVYSPLLYDQLKSFSEDPVTGKLQGSGEHDDLAIAFMLMCMGMLKPGVRARSRDLSEEVAEIPAIKVEDKKVIDISKFRNSAGEYLLPFEDMFPKRIGKNVHTGKRGGRA